MRGHQPTYYNFMSTTVYEINGIQNKTSAETAIHGRSAIKIFIAEIGILVGITSRPESE